MVYAGAAGLVLPPTSGKKKDKIKNAINNLSAGGSTAGGQGLQLAYSIAEENLLKDGINRIMLATDGDFNVGISSNDEMQNLVEQKRKKGVSISVLGFGMGNYKDSKMEIIADKGNGNYYYIDNFTEARKVLVENIGGTLNTIAKDVKIQIEFNPSEVAGYRLIGYANRKLKNEDFNNDKIDAGELGSGHTVTALYEIVPVGSKSNALTAIDDLKYQKVKRTSVSKLDTNFSGELLTVKFRYKKPDEDNSILLVQTVEDSDNSDNSVNFNFSAAVASYGLILRNSEYKGTSSFQEVLNLASKNIGDDKNGHRKEFIKLVKTAEAIGTIAQE